jgi:hypothetical protein
MTALAREAVVLDEATDFVNHRADAMMDLPQVLKLRGNEAITSASEALRFYQFKGNRVSESATRLWPGDSRLKPSSGHSTTSGIRRTIAASQLFEVSQDFLDFCPDVVLVVISIKGVIAFRPLGIFIGDGVIVDYHAIVPFFRFHHCNCYILHSVSSSSLPKTWQTCGW